MKSCTNTLEHSLRDRRLSIEAKAIYAYLHETADQEGRAYPYTDVICEELGIAKNRFFKHRKQLKECGYISMERPRQGNKYGVVVYTLNDCPEQWVCH